MLIQHERPADTANWLPAPAGEFYLDIRTWGPREQVRSGEWRPGAVTPLAGP